MKTFFRARHFLAALAMTAVFSSAAIAQDSAKSDSKAEPAKARPVAKASPTAKTAKPVSKVRSATPAVRALSVAVDLLSSTRLEGTLTDTTTLEMQTSFGGASIPLSEVAGIRFASAENATTTVVMLNGDSITGATDVKLVTVETEWGTASINGSNISSIMFVPGLDWNPASGLNGKRWNLINTKKPETKPRSTSTRSTSSRSTSSPTTTRSAPTNRSVPSSGSFQPGQVFPGN